MKRFITLLTLLLFVLLVNVSSLKAHWNSKGPYGGSVTCSVVADTNIYVGTEGGGVFRSKDKKVTTWKAVNTGLASAKITSLAVLGTVVYAATSDSGIFISNNLGENWTKINNGLSNLDVLSLYASGSTLFAGTAGGGVFISSDNGSNWNSSNTGLTNLTTTVITGSGNTIVVGTKDGGVFISTDNGSSWSEANTNLVDLHINALWIMNNTVYCATTQGVYASDITTINWTDANTGLSQNQVYTLYQIGSDLYAGTEDGIYTSPSNSIAWTALGDGLPKDTVKAICSFGSYLYAGTKNNGIFKSATSSLPDSASWAAFNLGLNNLKTYAIYASGNLIIAATNRGIYVSRDLAANYYLFNHGLTDSLNVTSLVVSGTTLFAGTKFGGAFMSADTGRTWSSCNSGLPYLSVSNLISTTSFIFASCDNGKVYVSPLTSINWVSTTGLPVGITITSFATDGSSVFVGTNGNGVFKSDNGTSWEDFNTGLTNHHINSIAVNGTRVFAATMGDGVFVSSVNSAQWVGMNEGLPILDVISLGVTGKYVIAGYRGGIHVTSDNGLTWQAPNVQLFIPGYANVTHIAFSDTRIFISASDNSLYSNAKAELPPLSVTNIDQEITTNLEKCIKLSPNPSHGLVKIELSKELRTALEVKVYSNKGALMEVIQLHGEDCIERNLPQGIYFIQVRSSDFSVGSTLIIE